MKETPVPAGSPRRQFMRQCAVGLSAAAALPLEGLLAQRAGDWAPDQGSLELGALRRFYAAGGRPSDVVRAIYERIAQASVKNVWITLVPLEEALRQADQVEREASALPLYGIPFAVKDNIDAAGLPTTAACREYAYTPERSSTVVQNLLAAGAILIGKTNLDQFATGLVGVRSPFGVCANAFNQDFIAGGSSSGSAVAVAAGLVSFSLGTDTAGSGRVPAGFNNLVGVKPTRGLVSASGVVPACRSLDCVSIFALTAEDGHKVLQAARGFDPSDFYSRKAPFAAEETAVPSSFRFGVPPADQLEFFGDGASARLFDEAVARLESIGGQRRQIDFTPFRATASLLYQGPWVAERLAALKDFYEAHPGAFHPVTGKIIAGAAKYSAVDAFRAFYRLEELRRQADAEWTQMDLLAVPTTGTIYTVRQVLDEPLALNTNLGYYTNFVNLLDYAAVATPSGMRRDGLPFGITLIGPAFSDGMLSSAAAAYQRAVGGVLGATGIPVPKTAAGSSRPARETTPKIELFVLGAHLSGQPLNPQLLSLGARLERRRRTAKTYRLYALPHSQPAKPGLVRTADGGVSVEGEVWKLDEAAFGRFVAQVPPPLTIGTVELEDGVSVKGFLCEPHGVRGAKDISSFGGWAAYLRAQDSRQ